jgi:hypothetical protein
VIGLDGVITHNCKVKTAAHDLLDLSALQA